MSIIKDDLSFLNECMIEAKNSIDRGDHPFGALLVHQQKTLIKSGNEVNSRKDVTAHAELRLIQKAQKLFDDKTIAESTLYTSTEPCAMCAGAIYWAGIRKIVFGCSAQSLFEITGGGLHLSNETLFSYAPEETEVKSYEEKADFKQVHHDFW